MKATWVTSDSHFSHKLMSTLRGFNSPEEMDEVLISKWNSRISPRDRVYHLGDFAINRRAIAAIAPRLNGNIVLIKGNHDIFKLSDYTDYFDDIRAYKVLSCGVILSHIPIHPDQLWDGSRGRYLANVHGHTHERELNDPRYINVCVEKTNLSPVKLDEILQRVKGK